MKILRAKVIFKDGSPYKIQTLADYTALSVSPVLTDVRACELQVIEIYYQRLVYPTIFEYVAAYGNEFYPTNLYLHFGTSLSAIRKEVQNAE